MKKSVGYWFILKNHSKSRKTFSSPFFWNSSRRRIFIFYLLVCMWLFTISFINVKTHKSKNNGCRPLLSHVSVLFLLFQRKINSLPGVLNSNACIDISPSLGFLHYKDRIYECKWLHLVLWNRENEIQYNSERSYFRVVYLL